MSTSQVRADAALKVLEEYAVRLDQELQAVKAETAALRQRLSAVAGWKSLYAVTDHADEVYDQITSECNYIVAGGAV